MALLVLSGGRILGRNKDVFKNFPKIPRGSEDDQKVQKKNCKFLDQIQIHGENKNNHRRKNVSPKNL